MELSRRGGVSGVHMSGWLLPGTAVIDSLMNESISLEPAVYRGAVHGELEQMTPFGQRLNEKLGVQVLMPKREEEIML